MRDAGRHHLIPRLRGAHPVLAPIPPAGGGGVAADGRSTRACPPRRCGFGSELIERGLPDDLGATTCIDIRPGEPVCSIEMPLTGETALVDLP